MFNYVDWSLINIMRLLSLLFLINITISPSFATECNKGVEPNKSQEELAYKDRGDRCEGLYIQPVATTGLRIIGFHSAPNRFSLSNKDISVTTSDVKNVKHLSIISTVPRQYYRLDTSFQTKSFNYSLDLVKHPSLNIRPSELSARVCVSGCDSLNPTLIAATFNNTKDTKDVPYITFQSTEDLAGLHIKIVDVRSKKIIFEQELLDGTVWPAWRPADYHFKNFSQHLEGVILTATARGRYENELDVLSAKLLIK